MLECERMYKRLNFSTLEMEYFFVRSRRRSEWLIIFILTDSVQFLANVDG